MASIFPNFTAGMFDAPDHRAAIARLEAAGLKVKGAKDRSSYWVRKAPIKHGGYDDTWLAALPVQDLAPQGAAPNGSWRLSNWTDMPTASVDEIMYAYPSFAQAVDSLLRYYFGQPTVLDGWVCPLHRHPELVESKVRAILPSAVSLSADQFSVITQERTARFWADVATRTPPLFLQWDEQRRTPINPREEKQERVTWLDELMITPGKRPPEGPLPLGSPYSLKDVSYPYWEFMIRSQFVLITHAEDPSRTLCLRRDLQEAYITCLGEGNLHGQ